MTSKSFRRSRQRSRRQRRSRRGGYGALANAASTSILPVGLTLVQQHYKKKNANSFLNKTRRFNPFSKGRN